MVTPIHVNTADLDTLVALPGVGEVLASRILQHREEHGPFDDASGLLEVQGVSPRLLARIQDQLSFSRERVAMPVIARNVHKRILEWINAANGPDDLTVLPLNEQPVLVDPEHRRNRPFRHEPTDEHEPKEEVKVLAFDAKLAADLLQFRNERHPKGINAIQEFGHIWEELRVDIRDLVISWFGGRTFGQWGPPITLADDDGEFSVVHAAVVNTGEVLMIEHACHSGVSKTPLWDPETQSLSTAPTPPTEGLYCSGHCFLSDGRLLVVGGRGDANHWPNDKDIAWLYDPASRSWDVTRDQTSSASPKPRTKMHHDRWYPTLVNLGDEPGRVLVASGDNSSNRTCNPPASPPPPMQMEIFSEQTEKFELVTTPVDKYHRPTYPGLHLLPGGEVFFAPVGFKSSGESTGTCPGNEDSAYLELTGTLSGQWTDVGPNDRTKGMSVTLLSNTYPYTQVMTVGGGDLATTRTYRLINLSTLNPSWDPPLSNPIEPGESEPVSWVHPNLVLLPDGTLFVCGGTPAGRPCWLYDPKTHNWSRMDAMTYERRYHSVAVLCTTGEVMATGGKHHDPGVETVEVFKPPYLFRGIQPKIDAVSPKPVHHGRELTIKTSQANDIAEVVLMRPMAVTHQTDSEQRRIQLSFTRTGSDTLIADAPNGRHPHAVAPRGWYMLFILNGNGVPSKAEFIELH